MSFQILRTMWVESFTTSKGRKISETIFLNLIFLDLPIFEGAAEVVEWLNTHFDLFIVTAAQEFPHSLIDKYHWLQKHLPFISWKQFVFCGDKSIIRADYMIDDHVHNLKTFDGLGLLFSASHNINENGYIRLNNWNEVKLFFEKELENEPAL